MCSFWKSKIEGMKYEFSGMAVVSRKISWRRRGRKKRKGGHKHESEVLELRMEVVSGDAVGIGLCKVS